MAFSGVQIPKVSALLVLDNEGKRIAVQYYDKACKSFSSLSEQQAFEKKLHLKTATSSARMDAEIILFEGQLCLYKFCSDACFFVFASPDENELLVMSILNALEETMSNLLRNQVSKKVLIDNLDLLLLTIDEIVDDGLILETDPVQITSRVAMKGADKAGAPLVEQTFSQALTSAKDQLVKSFQR